MYDGEWHFAVTPYAWLPFNIKANLRFNVPPELGGSPEIEVNSSSILSHLRFAGSLAGEARKREWALVMDLLYVDLGNQRQRFAGSASPGTVERAPDA
jgi:hypothetical protein